MTHFSGLRPRPGDGPVAQWVARRFGRPEAGGSRPPGSTHQMFTVPVAQRKEHRNTTPGAGSSNLSGDAQAGTPSWPNGRGTRPRIWTVRVRIAPRARHSRSSPGSPTGRGAAFRVRRLGVRIPSRVRGARSSSGRASVLHAEGGRFESGRVHATCGRTGRAVEGGGLLIRSRGTTSVESSNLSSSAHVAVAQGSERRAHNVEDGGSRPPGDTQQYHGSWRSLVSALALGARCRGFESRRPDFTFRSAGTMRR